MASEFRDERTPHVAWLAAMLYRVSAAVSMANATSGKKQKNGVTLMYDG